MERPVPDLFHKHGAGGKGQTRARFPLPRLAPRLRDPWPFLRGPGEQRAEGSASSTCQSSARGKSTACTLPAPPPSKSKRKTVHFHSISWPERFSGRLKLMAGVDVSQWEPRAGNNAERHSMQYSGSDHVCYQTEL